MFTYQAGGKMYCNSIARSARIFFFPAPLQKCEVIDLLNWDLQGCGFPAGL